MMTKSITYFGVAAVALMSLVPAAQAQDGELDNRVDRLEKEMRAVQRTVFPGGNPAFFEGEIAPDNTPGERVRSGAPVIDLTARVDALEEQLQTLTGQTEENAYQLRQLEKQFTEYKAEMDKRFAAPAAEIPADDGSTVKPPRTTATTTNKPDADRLALVKAVEIPTTGDEAKDAYTYGFRLWDAKLYPEAQAQLKQVVEKWPDSGFASRAQNLLGRAYLDEGKSSLAAVAFYNNYKDRPSGARAPHSLMYMGIALDRLGRSADACKAFRELEDVYGDKTPQDVRDDAAAAKAKAGC